MGQPPSTLFEAQVHVQPLSNMGQPPSTLFEAHIYNRFLTWDNHQVHCLKHKYMYNVQPLSNMGQPPSTLFEAQVHV